MTAPVGKYFIGVHDGARKSGIFEAAIDATHSVPRYQSALRGGACAGMIKRSSGYCHSRVTARLASHNLPSTAIWEALTKLSY